MQKNKYADIILPLAVRGRFTYSIPGDLAENIKPGVMVSVRFGGNKITCGVVFRTHNDEPGYKNIKPIYSVISDSPLVNEIQFRLWQWISDYYLCSEGEVMKAALPGVAGLVNYRPKLETYIALSRKFTEQELNDILDSLKKAPRQKNLLNTYLGLTGYKDGSEIVPVRKAALLEESYVAPGITDILVKKGIFDSITKPVSRLSAEDGARESPKDLSLAQSVASESVKNQLSTKDVVLLHGVTSSGKTEIYIHLIAEQIEKGRQVLYMLPEIALTTQIILRLKKHFGSAVGVYHSRLSDPEKVEIWKRVADNDVTNGYRLILGVRSSLFLPFSDLGLIIIDEEHDSSYKQHDPSPRYHARDTAIVLASLHNAKTILGSASPSVESYNNAVNGKFGLTELKERYGLIRLPSIVLANTREAYRKKLMVSHFTPELLQAMDEALGNEEQIILFQNRRGFSPYIECSECGWIPVCVQCAVNLTYHKSINKLVCHYCGYTTSMPSKCNNCHSTSMVTRGFGTEKIEDEIKIIFPAARVARMDQDTTRGKSSFNKIIAAFEERRIDILIGTQMISKGLDFENLTVVGILNADNLLNYPDFRAHERSFQLMEQVSGRAGRRKKQGKVIIQTSDPANRIIRLLLRHDYQGMFRMQVEERMAFSYPPFSRMIRLNIRHRDRSQLNYYADFLGRELKNSFGKRVLGPESPVISQVQSWYIKTILIKIEKERPITRAKQLVTQAIDRIGKEKGASTLRIAVDVDPY